MRSKKFIFFKQYVLLPPKLYTPQELKILIPDSSDFIDAEYLRISDMIDYESRIAPGRTVIGSDEAGRGPLAGHVVAAAVVFPKPVFIPLINDSKKLTSREREFLYDLISQYGSIAVSTVTAAEIDQLNILQASLKGMKSAVSELCNKESYVIVDGNKMIPGLSVKQSAVIKGDSKCFSVACASIVAKVFRDKLMDGYNELYPEYAFSAHKGYGTQKHRDAIERYGVIKDLHRLSFLK